MPINYDQSGVVYDSTTYTYDGEVFSPSVFPTAGVFIAWNDGPYVANPGWTEITPYVREISIRRGRADDFEQFDTGTAQLVLDNRARTFDPFYTSGPNYLKLTPRRQIKIVAQIGGVNYDVFRGYVAGWPVTWAEAGYDSTVTIQAFDALGLMANEQVPTDWNEYYISSLAPRYWYRFNDAQGGTTVNEYYGQTGLARPLSTLPYYYKTSPLGGGYSYDASFCPQYGTVTDITESGAQDFSVAGWVQFLSATDVSTTDGGLAVQFAGRQLVLRFAYQTFTEGGLTYTANRFYLKTNGYSGTVNTQTRYDVTIGGSVSQPVHFVMTYTASTGAGKIYLNGVDCTSIQNIIGNGSSSSNNRYLPSFYNAACQDIAVFPRVLSATEISTLFAYGSDAVTETTTARMNRLIGTTTYPTLLTSFTASPVATVSEIGSGTGVIPEMQLVADSEGGEIYVSKSGLLTTTNRTDVFNATRSANVQAIITYSGTGLRYGTELEIQYDADALKNDVTVNYSGDGEVSATSSAIISAYGASSTVIETQLADPTSAQQLALMELGVEGSLVPRISPIDVSANTAAADWQTILGLELLDRVTFKRTPSVGNQFSRDALVNAIEHQIVPGVWRTQLTLSMRYTSPLTLDDDVLGTLDFNYLG